LAEVSTGVGARAGLRVRVKGGLGLWVRIGPGEFVDKEQLE
jgi:hypothetical protein